MIHQKWKYRCNWDIYIYKLFPPKYQRETFISKLSLAATTEENHHRQTDHLCFKSSEHYRKDSLNVTVNPQELESCCYWLETSTSLPCSKKSTPPQPSMYPQLVIETHIHIYIHTRCNMNGWRGTTQMWYLQVPINFTVTVYHHVEQHTYKNKCRRWQFCEPVTSELLLPMTMWKWVWVRAQHMTASSTCDYLSSSCSHLSLLNHYYFLVFNSSLVHMHMFARLSEIW